MKIRKILLPMATVCATASLVTPLLTSCSKGVNVLEKQESKYSFSEEPITRDANNLKQIYIIKNGGSSNGNSANIFKDDFIVNMSDAVNNGQLSSITSVLANYNIYFDDKNLSITDTGIKFNFCLDFKTSKEFSFLTLVSVKDVKVHFEIGFEANFSFSFVQKENTEAGNYDHVLLVMTYGGSFTAKVKASGSCEYKGFGKDDYQSYSFDGKEHSISIGSESTNILEFLFDKFVVQFFNDNGSGSGWRIECPYFRNVNIR